jgi:hypothetical protein
MTPQLIETTFKVDLLALVWITVAVVVVAVLAAQFYRALEGIPGPLRPRSVSSPQSLWLTGLLGSFWSLDALWHARAFVVTPRFWRPQTRFVLQEGLPWLKWTVHLWSRNPILWDFSVLAVDIALASLVWVNWRGAPRWVLWGGVAWGVVRWALVGASIPVAVGVAVVGPGGFLLAGLTAYLLYRPQRFTVLLPAAGTWLAVDAMLAARHGPPAAEPALALGLMVLAWGLRADWPSRALRALAVLLTIDVALLGVDSQIPHWGLNWAWAPALLVLVLGFTGRGRTAELAKEVSRH